MPGVAVAGVGAVALGVPHVAAVYQFSVPVPVAVNACAVAFKQYAIGATVGAAGAGLTVTTISALGPSHATPLVVIV